MAARSVGGVGVGAGFKAGTRWVLSSKLAYCQLLMSSMSVKGNTEAAQVSGCMTRVKVILRLCYAGVLGDWKKLLAACWRGPKKQIG
jgi:hypothetical protein